MNRLEESGVFLGNKRVFFFFCWGGGVGLWVVKNAPMRVFRAREIGR